jgi:hypothetical protein
MSLARVIAWMVCITAINLIAYSKSRAQHAYDIVVQQSEGKLVTAASGGTGSW